MAFRIYSLVWSRAKGYLFLRTPAFKSFKTSFFLWYPIDASEKEKEKNEMVSKGSSKHLTLGGIKLPLHNMSFRCTRNFLGAALQLSYHLPTSPPTGNLPFSLHLQKWHMAWSSLRHLECILYFWSTNLLHLECILCMKQIKEKHPAREQEKKKERTKVQTKDHTRKCRMHILYFWSTLFQQRGRSGKTSVLRSIASSN